MLAGHGSWCHSVWQQQGTWECGPQVHSQHCQCSPSDVVCTVITYWNSWPIYILTRSPFKNENSKLQGWVCWMNGICFCWTKDGRGFRGCQPAVSSVNWLQLSVMCGLCSLDDDLPKGNFFIYVFLEHSDLCQQIGDSSWLQAKLCVAQDKVEMIHHSENAGGAHLPPPVVLLAFLPSFPMSYWSWCWNARLFLMQIANHLGFYNKYTLRIFKPQFCLLCLQMTYRDLPLKPPTPPINQPKSNWFVKLHWALLFHSSYIKGGDFCSVICLAMRLWGMVSWIEQLLMRAL